MKQKWSPTQESFERLLTWLDSDQEQAAQKYERIRLRLIKFYICDGCGDDDDHLTDLTFDRVMKKLDAGQVPEPFTGDKALYFLAFAKNIRLEHQRSRRPVEVPPPNDDTKGREDEDFCLEECARILHREDHWVAVEYYRFEKSAKIEHRKKIANEIGLTMPGLRTRVHRIKDDLKPCIEECLERRLSETL